MATTWTITEPDADGLVSPGSAVAFVVHDGVPGVGVPPGGTVGHVVVKTGGGDYQTGWQAPPSGASFTHSQGSAAATWTVNHNLGVRPAVEVRTTGGQVVVADVLHASADQVLISFATAVAGTAYCSL